MKFSEFVDVFLERHEKVRAKTTVDTLRARLVRPLEAFGDVTLADLESMSDDLAGFAANLPDRFRCSVVSTMRQTFEAAVRYGYRAANSAKFGPKPQPPPRTVRLFTAAELDALGMELDARGAAAIRFAAATGLRPAEWASLERRDVDKARRVAQVRGTKTLRSRREVPLTAPALAALESLPPRLDSPYVFASPRGGPFDVANFRRRDWRDAVEASGITKPARLYDLRSTFASNALAAGITTFELARIMGTSVGMIEAHYGALIDTAHGSILARLEGFGAQMGHDDEAEDG